MLRATLKSLLSHKLRLLLSGLAVILGVMFVSGALVLTETIGRSFDQLLGTAYDDVDVVVTGEEIGGNGVPEGTPIPGEIVASLAALPEVDDNVRAEVFAIGAKPIDNRTGKVVSTFSVGIGSNWAPVPGLTEMREGTGPSGDHEVAINSTLARTGGFSVGDPITVRVPRSEESLTFTVAGVFGYEGGRDSLFGETHVAFTTPVAQELMLGQGDVFTEVSLFAAGDTSPEQLRDLVAAEVGDQYQVRTGERAAADQSDQIREQLSFLNYILLGFAGVALFVGIFLVLNTFSIIVAQRLRELALLRAVGASRRQMVGSVLLEATIIGLIASLGGLLLGVGVGSLLAAVLDVAPGAGVAVPVSAVVAAFTVGLLVTLVAALLPALRAARVPPVAAMQEAATGARPLTRLTLAGAAVTLAATAALAVSLTGNAGDGTLPLLLAGVLLAFVGVALLTPLIARPVTSVLGRLFAWSVPGTLGRRNTGRNPRRTAITAAALMVGVALVTGVSTVFSSLSASFGDTIEDDLQAELIIAGEWTGGLPPTFDATIPDQARQLPDVAAVAAAWFEIAGTDFVTAVDDSAAWRDIAGLTTVDGSLAGLSSGQVLVDDRTAERDGLAVGDTVPIDLPRAGERAYTVAGIYERVPNLTQGFVFSAEDVDGFSSVNPVEAYVDVRDGGDVAAVRAALDRLLADSPEVLVQDRSGYVEQQTRTFDQVLVFIQVLLVLAMVIAVLGVVNTLVLSVIERTRELGLLRAVGLGRGATARMVTVESVVISLFGALLGVVVGAALGAAAVYALRDEGFTDLSFPWVLMAVYLVLAALVGVVAAVIPAVRAARLNVLAAIAYE